MPILRPSLFFLALPLVGASCSLGGFYEEDKEYVLYDSTTPPPTGSPERTEQDRIAAEAGARPEQPGDEDAAANVGRIFVLENLRDELDRAIAAGAGDLDALRQKQQDVERELTWRTAEAGEGLGAARVARLGRLLEFPVVVR